MNQDEIKTNVAAGAAASAAALVFTTAFAVVTTVAAAEAAAPAAAFVLISSWFMMVSDWFIMVSDWFSHWGGRITRNNGMKCRLFRKPDDEQHLRMISRVAYCFLIGGSSHQKTVRYMAIIRQHPPRT